VRWWLISVGMTADTTRPAADDDAYTLVENLAGMGTLVSAPSTLRYLELTYEAFKLAAEPGRRWRLPAGLGDDGAPRGARQIVTGCRSFSSRSLRPQSQRACDTVVPG
jgi:hypothetical protein